VSAQINYFEDQQRQSLKLRFFGESSTSSGVDQVKIHYDAAIWGQGYHFQSYCHLNLYAYVHPGDCVHFSCESSKLNYHSCFTLFWYSLTLELSKLKMI
jgi:hypothetical protein